MQICCAGEVMIEMAAQETAGLYRAGAAGDSFNTAVYLARQGLPVLYLTRIGDDTWSDRILTLLREERIGSELVTRVPGCSPGLYTVDNDEAGERNFSYWRGQSPARDVFRDLAPPHGLSHFYFTGVTLAISQHTLPQLIALLETLRAQQTVICFDPNYRSVLWPDVATARRHYESVLPLCDIVLPSQEDDMALWSIRDTGGSLRYYDDAGIGEIVLKDAELTTHVRTADSGGSFPAERVDAIDTTGAGDAFNAAYLGARLTGADIADAVSAAQILAGEVVQYRGAILPRGAERWNTEGF